jgi:endonuclease III-like uncharacterized protein
MPSLSSIIGQASRGADLYFVFRFLRLLTVKYTSTNAYKLGIIDKKGKALKKSAELESTKEKSSYTMLHRMVWKIRGLMEKIPVLGKSILMNYAAALFLLKEQNDTRVWTDDGYMKSKLLEFLETDWKADAKFLKEEVDNMNRKSFSTFLTETKLEESQELQAMMALDDAGIEAVINRKGQIVIDKKDLKNAEKALKKSFRKGGAPEIVGEEVSEGWKKGKYTIKDDKGKILGTYSSGGKAQKAMDDLMQKGDYDKLTVAMVEEVKVEEAFKPHKMYDPKTGKAYDADTEEDHLKYKKIGYTHEKPQVKKEGAAEFMAAASAAKRDGKKKFKFGGKEYPVTIKVDIPLASEEIANSVGGGNVAGIGVGAQGEPGKKKKKKDIKESVQMSKFAGKDVFIVDSDTYHACRLGKKQYARYEKYVGKNSVGLAIREYGLKYPKRPIILQNGDVGPMLYLKYGRS